MFLFFARRAYFLGLLRILTRYWHTTKDAWYNIFVCQCCACTNHTGQAPDPLTTAATTTLGDTLLTSDYPLREREDPDAREREDPATETCDSKHDDSAVSIPEYPDSEIDDWNWDELETSPSMGATIPTQPQKNTLPHVLKNGPDSGSTLEENLSIH